MTYTKTIAFIIVFFFAASAMALVNPSPYDLAETPIDDGSVISLKCDVTSKPVLVGEDAVYNINVTNLTDQPQQVNLSIERHPRNVMPTALSPSVLHLAPSETTQCRLAVTVLDRIPVGGQETCVVRAAVRGNCQSEELTFITVRFRPHPYMLVTEDLLEEVRQKMETYDWARKSFENLRASVQNLEFPAPRRLRIEIRGMVWYGLYNNRTIERVWDATLIYKITGDETIGDRVLAFLRATADPDVGYPTTRWATNSNAYVHEGEFFTFYSAIYDLMYNEPQLTEEDHGLIQETLRLYLETCDDWHIGGDIGNWVTTVNTAAICASLALQDMTSLDFFINGPQGFVEQIASGIMGDGWWLEGASNYSYLVAMFYGYAAQACQNWGLNLWEKRVPMRSLNDSSRRWRNGWMSMNFDIWGPPGEPYRGLKDLYDSATILMDEEGYVVANNDSGKKKPGNVFELAYYHYRDPEYAWMITRNSRDDWASLIYGVGEVPDVPDPRSQSGYVDNVGIAALRSQTSGRDASEQIQAYLKWGSHGGWHGHFDRTDFLAMDRYGQEFYEPEAAWFGYGSYLYKAWVQPTISHNVVIVDGLQQEPVESDMLLFYGGQALQACAVETNARWAQKLPWDRNDPADLDPDNDAKMVDYGDAKPVQQRRLMLVTDDYVVLADYMNAPQDHVYDWLVHPVGYLGTEAESIQYQRHTERFLDDPDSSYYFITDCDWYSANSPVINRFQHGVLKTNIHTLWPQQTTMAIGTFPMPLARISYEIFADGEDLDSGWFDANKFSVHEVDVPVQGRETLTVTFAPKTRTKIRRDVQSLGNPRFILADGSTAYLADMNFIAENIKGDAPVGVDYYGGDIQMVGEVYEKGIMVEPQGRSGTITVDLSGIDAVRFQADIIVDEVEADMAQSRRTLLFRTQGSSAQYLTVLEPHRDEPMIVSAVSQSPEHLTVTLFDGRVQEIEIGNFYTDSTDIEVTLTEYRNGEIIRQETAINRQ